MTNDRSGSADGEKRCFVVMGFGIKTDYATGRKLDLDKAYRALIKPVVEARGLACVRADEIRHSGTIDVPMYQELLTAHVVIADISTANPNAIYELGIRHALRPRTTIVISENKLSYPFDLNHVLISSYTHLGDVIDYDEVLRFQKVLGETLDAVLSDPKPDSPVYTYLRLTPPSLREEAATAVARAGDALEKAGDALAAAGARLQTTKTEPSDRTLATLIESGERAIRDGRFPDAKDLFTAAVGLCQGHPASSAHLPDPYLVQRLVLATYKEEQPTLEKKLFALAEAKQLLDSMLAPAESNDPETVGLAGAIEKRLFDRGQGSEHLNRAIQYYARGYFLRTDRYNGINLAYLLNVRSDTELDAFDQERIADLVWANRIRREVLPLCEQELSEIRGRNARGLPTANELKAELRNRDWEEEFWCLATQAEAYFGLGLLNEYATTRARAECLAPPPAAWMIESLDRQIGRLGELLKRHGHLLSPPWAGV